MPARAEEPAGHAAPLACSVEEAARLLGIGRTVMFQLVMAGDVDSIKIGRRRLIPREAIDAYLRRLRDQQPPPPQGS